MSIKDDHIHKN